MKHLLMASAMLCACAIPAFADNITLFTSNANTDTLTIVSQPPPGNEPQNNPCLICASTQPGQPANFGDNNYKQTGAENAFIEFSSATVGDKLDQDTIGTGYSVSFLKAFLASVGDTKFNVGIDVNTATGAGAEILERFAVLDLTTHTILANFNGPFALTTANNGSGFPDFLLTGFDINRNDINIGDSIVFYARWSNASDGGEQFFLVPTAAVPAPLAGAGIPGLIAACGVLFGLHRRRRNLAA